jgi:hypothetical protein
MHCSHVVPAQLPASFTDYLSFSISSNFKQKAADATASIQKPQHGSIALSTQHLRPHFM